MELTIHEPLLGGSERQARFKAFLESCDPSIAVRDLARRDEELIGWSLQPNDCIEVVAAVDALLDLIALMPDMSLGMTNLQTRGLRVTRSNYKCVTVAEVLGIWEQLTQYHQGRAALIASMGSVADESALELAEAV